VLAHLALKVPESDIESGEEPDFILTLNGQAIGIEVTDLFIESSSVSPLPEQALENEERFVVNGALELARKNRIPPQLLQCRLSRHFLGKQNRQRLVRLLYEWVAANYAQPMEVVAGHERGLPREIYSVMLCGLKSEDHKWNGSCSGFVCDEFSQGFETAINKKTKLLPKYLHKCDTCWLVTAAWQNGGSSFIEWSDDTAAIDFETGFERVFFVEHRNQRVNELSVLSREAAG
tara:strand:+ start:7728 stop:8426 length:699 start_codon:yes stop_codon:yes gene_type:complete